MNAPKKVPKPGFYYHHKHDQSGQINNYAYEVLGVGFHTEDDCRPEDMNLVVYRPLYESPIYKAGKFFYLRPLQMWTGDVIKDGKTSCRFQKITDEETLFKLSTIRDQMYG